MGCNKVIFEMDCKILVDDIHNNKLNRYKYDSFIHSYRTCLLNYLDYIVVFVRPQANDSAGQH
jgi:hypothetical protein